MQKKPTFNLHHNSVAMKISKRSIYPRRTFLRMSAMGAMAAGMMPCLRAASSHFFSEDKPLTNIDEAMKHPRLPHSMPGKFPGQVVKVFHGGSVVQNQPDAKAAYRMIENAMLELTGKHSLKEAWLVFVEPGDRIGLKVNPVAGASLSTSPEVTEAVIWQLTEAGIPSGDIMIWDRREFQLHEAGFTPERFPGITIRGTEQQDREGSFYDATGELYGKYMIDTGWYYRAEVEGTYNRETLPYMVNEGRYSYFTRILTQELDKIINIPILKNAGSTVTLCMKNLAYGSVTNTGRLHQQLWAETCAEVNAFPPLRDKLVLNIVDGLKGCYQGGPGANPQFFTDYRTILVGSDPVAVDRAGYDIVLEKRIKEGIQAAEVPSALRFMELSEQLQLGIADPAKIVLKELTMS